MTKLFSRVRLLALGGAKAHTNGDLNGPYLEDDFVTPSRIPG